MRANKGEIKKRVTIVFDAEQKVLIQLQISAGIPGIKHDEISVHVIRFFLGFSSC
jgi:hypothetical protein